jgi:hypothetical protein
MLSIAVTTLFREYQAPLFLLAFATDEGTLLETRAMIVSS